MNTRNKAGHHKIAIVGTGSIFPGSLDSKTFWLNILAEKDFIKDVPATHWLKEDYYDVNDKTGDKIYCKKGSFLDDIPFDPVEFGMPPNILSTTDTVQLLSLVVARDTLADTLSYQNGKVDPKKVSVILGVAGGTELIGQMSARIRRPEWTAAMRKQGLAESQIQLICDEIAGSYTKWNENTFPGLLGNVVSGRVANRFDLKGTNCVIDAACASSLGAIKMAVQELQLGTTDMVLSGGADALNDIFMYMCFSKTTALSPSEDCRPFSAAGDGTILGEGVAMLALKRLEDAQNDGDRIYAVISAIGSSSDGKSKSIYAPDSNGQCLAVSRAYEQAGFGVEEIELIEGHGTGTIAGDYAEFNGLRLAYGETTANQYCALGSIKSQIGHTKSAAGAASVLKTALALNNAILPATLKVDKPNPKLDIQNSPFYLNTAARPWIHESTTTRKAGVSSMGFGGTNFHVAMEEYNDSSVRPKKIYQQKKELFLFSGDTTANVLQQINSLVSNVNEKTFVSIAKQTQLQFKAGDKCRLALLGEDVTEINKWAKYAQDKLTAGDAAFEVKNSIYYNDKQIDGKIAFLFSGQGSQYINMGTGLLMQYDEALAPWNNISTLTLDPQQKLNHVVYPIPVFDSNELEKQKQQLVDTRWAQPAIGTLALSHLGLLNKLGIKPAMAGGHSYGEVVALYAAGVIKSAEDMVKISRKRGELMAECSEEAGAMTAVFASSTIVDELLKSHPTDVVIANINSPAQVVITGKLAGIEEIEKHIAIQGLKFQRLNVSTAFHSELVGPSSGEFKTYLDQFSFSKPVIPVYSNTTAGVYSNDKAKVAGTLAKQLACPVQFVSQIEAMYAEGARIFVEVGPGKIQTNFINDILIDRPHTALSVDGGAKQNSKDALWNALAQLSVNGVVVNYEAMWDMVGIATDIPTKKAPSVATVHINGSNFNKPYPPKGGYSALPLPNPEVAIKPMAEAKTLLPTPAATVVANNLPAQTIKAIPLTNEPTIPAPIQYQPNQQKQGKKMSEPTNQWMNAFQEIQKNILTAQQSFQDTLAQNHQLFLQTSQIAFEQLGGIINNAPVAHQLMPNAPAMVKIEQNSLPQQIVQPVQQLIQPIPQPVAVVKPVAAPVYTERPVVAPQPVAVAAPIAPPAKNNIDLKDTILTIVSEKTGYPKEILDLDTDLESGLGIDSIKRVEILSALQEVFPSLKNVETSRLAAMNTLGEILNFSGGADVTAAPQNAIPNVTAPVDGLPTDFEDNMLQIVSDKTGYPKEILDLDMDLESGLGIDSIKRVEILSALQEKFPVLKGADTARLAAMNTLGEILDFAGGASNTAIEHSHHTKHVTVLTTDSVSDDFEDSMLQIVSEKTGYPKEILDLTMDLESGLGIDSIKRVEILSALQEKFPVLKGADTARLAAMNTLGEILEFASTADIAIITETSIAEKKKPELSEHIFRHIVTKVPIEDEGFGMANWRDAKPLYIVSDNIGVAEPLSALFKGTGIDTEITAILPDNATHAIYLKGINQFGETGYAGALEINTDAFKTAVVLGKNLFERPGTFILALDNGLNDDVNRAWCGGLSALAKTAKLEWPKADVQSINISCTNISPVNIAENLFRAITSGGVVTEMEIDNAGNKTQLTTAIQQVTNQSRALSNGDVVIVSGGAKGVTAACLEVLAERKTLKFGIFGRTALIDEPAYLKDIVSDADIKKAILTHYTSEGKKITPIELNNLAAQVSGQREVIHTLNQIKSTGSSVLYLPVDVCSKAEVESAVDTIRSQFGKVSAIVHAAGVLADKYIHEKTPQQFSKVFDTKIQGFINLLDATANDALTHICCFSSVSARMGNPGQADYAMANEVLNKVCAAEQLKRKDACVVKSINWGPWDGGMVSPQLKNHFKSLGVALIPLYDGAQIFANEMEDSSLEHTEIVVGGVLEKWGAPASEAGQQKHDIWVHQSNHPFLTSHVIQDKVVVPIMMASEWCMRLAKSIYPGLQIDEVTDMNVYKGIQLANYYTTGDVFNLVYKTETTGNATSVAIKIFNAAQVLFYGATVKLSEKKPKPAAAAVELLQMENWDWSKKEIYKSKLFHGEDFHIISGLEGINDESCRGSLKVKNTPAAGNTPGLKGMFMFDGGIQMATLAMAKWTGNTSSLPLGYHSLQLFTDKIDTEMSCELKLKKRGTMDSEWDVFFMNKDREVTAEINGLRMYMYQAN